MSFFARLRFIIGLLVVIVVVAVLFLFLNYSMSNISSRKATLEADIYTVSSDYDGILKHQFVSPGDKVKEGDQLFEISSSTLTQAIRNNQTDEKSLLFKVTDEGNMILLANTSGTVQQINYTNGSYIAAKSTIATITTNNARYVIASYILNAPDYARINRANPVEVTLPDNSRFQARVFDISLERDGEQVFTVVRARLPSDASILPSFTSGTPISSKWQLDNSKWQNTLFRYVEALIEPQTHGK